MKIVELDKKEFDRYVITEPDCSLYHTSKWVSYFNNPKSEYHYLAYQDDVFYFAFAIVEIYRKNIFSRKEAFVDYGYIINYYDLRLLKNFHNDLVAWLNEKDVKTLTISPNIPYRTQYGNNAYLLKAIQELGYEKIEDTFNYSYFPEEEDDKESLLSLNISEMNINDADIIEKQFSYNVKDVLEHFKDDVKIMALSINTIDSLVKINDSLEEDKENGELDNLRAAVEKIMNEYENDLIVEYICYIKYDRYAYILFTDSLNSIDTDRALFKEVMKKEKDIKALYCQKPFRGAKKEKRIGRYIFNL
ncbi:MAG: peptidoglycan bridge formation glycyltransferase FemA/FemB family protein [Erysipelotrichaceae bacterium]|nr:peptidoglycan bridge formation glycyltransferase FemA/FemB family protein [Erysipelotrichaceae bacterium]